MSPAAKGVLKAVGIITILTLLSRLTGLIRKLAQSWAMSDGAVATAYDTANTVPNVLFEIAAGGALAGAVIPLISGFLARSLKKEAEQTASALICWVLLIGVPVAVVVAAAADPISRLLFGAEADPAIVDLATTLLRMFAVQIPLYGLSVIFTGILQAHKKFVLPALSPLLSSLVVIVVFLAYSSVNPSHAQPSSLSWATVAWLGWGTTAGVIIFSLPQLIPAARLLSLRPTLRFPTGVARRTLRLAGAGLGALLAQQIAIIAIMIVANKAGGVGAYNTFNYAWAMFMVPYAVLAVPIATATFPQISRAAGVQRAGAADYGKGALSDVSSSQSDVCSQRSASVAPHLARLIAQSTRLVSAMGIAAAAMLIVLSKPAQIVLELGEPIEYLDTALIAMGVGVAGYSIMYHCARVLYALECGRWVILSNSLGWGGVLLGLIVTLQLGIEGRFAAVVSIGISMSVGLALGALLVLVAIARVAGRAALAGIVHVSLVAIFTECVVSVPTWFAVRAILDAFGAGIWAAIVSAAVGACILAAAMAAVIWVIDREAVRALR